MRFSVGGTRGDHCWWLHASNGRPVAWAGETFSSQSNADRAARAFKAGAATARYEVYEDSASRWRWRAWQSSDKVAASGEAFASKHSAEAAAQHVREDAGGATGP